jgi:serine/threonine protein phosphatase 1
MKEPSRAVHRYPRNDLGRDFVVGDVHGCFGRLHAELEARQFDPRRDRLFAVGDLVDRGPESEHVLEAVARFGIRSVRGNHEDAIVRWHGGEEQALSLLGNGANWLLDRAADDEWVDRIAAYMASLPYAIEIETAHGLIGIVHADSPMSDWSALVREIEREPADGVTRKKVLWQRSRWKTPSGHPSPSRNTLRGLLNRAKASVRSQMHATGYVENVTAVFVGHTPVSVVTAKENVINIDTGAVYGGKLTLIDLDDVPQWIEVPDYTTAHGAEAISREVRREPVPARREPERQEPVMAARRREPVANDSAARAAAMEAGETAVMEKPVAFQEPVDTEKAREPEEKVVAASDDAPQLAPESAPAPEPLTSFVSNGMHITVRMSLNLKPIVNDR